MMYSVLLSVFMADPSGLAAALQSADNATVRYLENNVVITLNGDELKRIAHLVDTKGDVKAWEVRGALGTKEVFDIQVGDERFTLISLSALMFGPMDDLKVVTTVDSKLYDAIRAHFVTPEIPAESRPTVIQTIADAGSPSLLTIDDNGMLLVVDTAGNRLSLFGRLPQDGLLREPPLTFEHEDLLRPSAMVQRDLRIYLAGNTGIAILERPTKRSVDYRFIRVHPSMLRQPTGLAISPDSKYLYCACFGDDRLSVYSIEKNGKLILVEEFGHSDYSHPTGLIVTATHVYVVSHDHALLTLSRDERSGELQFVAFERDVNVKGTLKPENRGLTFASGIILEGKKLYTIGLSGTLNLWETDEAGLPKFVKRWDRNNDSFGLSGAKSVALGSDSRVWVAGMRDHAVAWFDRLNKRGMVTFGGKIDDLTSAKCLAISPDGRFVYAGGERKIWTIATSGPNVKQPGAYGQP